MLTIEQKNKLKYYLSLNYPMSLTYEKDDGVYFVEFPDLPGCMAHGKTPTDAYKLAQKVKREWLEDVLVSGKTIPEPKSEEDFSGKFVVRIPSSLHKDLSRQAEKAGRSLNQHVGFLLAERSNALSTENSANRLDNTIKNIETIATQQKTVFDMIESSASRLIAAAERMEYQQRAVNHILKLTQQSGPNAWGTSQTPKIITGMPC